MMTRYVYVRADEQALERLGLCQSPADSRFFELRHKVGRANATDPSKVEWLRPKELSDIQGRPRTDLASVPPFLWTLAAPYGRQTVPALFHDRDADRAHRLGEATKWKEGWSERRKADNEFYAGLRSNRVPVVRAWVMWAAVRVQAYWAQRRAWLGVLLVLHAVLVGLVWAAAFVLVALLAWSWLVSQLGVTFGAPYELWVPLLMLAASGITVAFWGGEAPMAFVLVFAISVLGVPLLLTTLSFLWFRLIDAIAWPFDPDRGPIFFPTVMAELRTALQRVESTKETLNAYRSQSEQQ